MKTIVVANRKGGVGKSTVAYNLGAAYALAGSRVCFLDLDSQANLTHLCNVKPTTLEGFKRCEPLAVSPVLSILPATKAFAQLEDEINRLIDRNSYIRLEVVSRLSGFDYLIVDTSPSLSILNINAFCCADMVHVVVNADSFSLLGLVEMRTILEQVKAINPRLDHRIVLNAAHKNRNITAAALDALRREPGFAGVEIPNRQHVIDSNARRRPALDLDDIREPFRALAAVI